MAVKIFNGLSYNLKAVTNNTKKFKANLNDFFVLKLFLYFGGIF
jgi:uncharacterized membrane protein YoaK (UPF0700 family)